MMVDAEVRSHERLARRHVAFLVTDIEESIEMFATSAGIEFGEVRTVPVRLERASTAIALDVTFVHAVDGTTELVEISEGPFALEAGLGFHHLGGVATDDFASAIERQRAYGAEVEWRLLMEDTLIAVFFEPTPSRPVRFELMTPNIPGQ